MKKITYYLSFKKNKITYSLLLILSFILLVLLLSYHSYKKLTQKTLYVGCLYSKTGVLGEAPYYNYKILVDSFKYSVNKYDAGMLNIVPIYKDLGDDLENFSKWVEECVQKYNIKYFFGCWRSTERRQVIPILEKYNARLFYPLQYEGFEASKNIFYLGGCPNQQIIPGLQYMFDAFYFYSDVYVIGSDYSYPKITTKVIDNYIKITKKIYNKKLVSVQFLPLDETDFYSFINNVFTKSPEGAIIVNLINGNSYYTFCKQFYEMYESRFENPDKKLFTSQNYAIKHLENPNLKNILRRENRYPSISTSIVENDINKENAKYLKHNLFVWNFASKILTDPIYYVTQGYKQADVDYVFLNKYIKKQNKPIGDTQYFTFVSTLFFVKTLKKMITENIDINNTDLYDKFKEQNIFSVGGEHGMRDSNHIAKNFYVLHVNGDGEFEILFDSYKNIIPAPYIFSTDKMFSVGASDERFDITDRIYG